MFGYWIDLEPDDNKTLRVSCRQLPIVASFGDDEAAALRHAVGAVEEALASMIEDGEDVPYPEAGAGTQFVALPLLPVLKLHLYWALRETGLSRAELCRRLGWNRESVDRLFRLDHRSRLEQIEAALAALGREIEVDVHKAA